MLQHPLHRKLHEFRAIFNAQFAANIFAVGIDRMNAQVQLPRNCFRSLPMADQLQDLQFSIAQAMHGFEVAVLLLSAVGSLVQQPLCDQGADVELPRYDLLQSGQDVILKLAFINVSAAPARRQRSAYSSSS